MSKRIAYSFYVNLNSASGTVQLPVPVTDASPKNYRICSLEIDLAWKAAVVCLVASNAVGNTGVTIADEAAIPITGTCIMTTTSTVVAEGAVQLANFSHNNRNEDHTHQVVLFELPPNYTKIFIVLRCQAAAVGIIVGSVSLAFDVRPPVIRASLTNESFTTPIPTSHFGGIAVCPTD